MDFPILQDSIQASKRIMTQLNELTAISPVDGRYRSKTKDLAAYFSEFALIKYRVHVEIEYFIALVEMQLPELQDVPYESAQQLREIVLNFELSDAERIKEIERTTNHDVKAVEYYLREQFKTLGLSAYVEFIHFGLTSQDINNTAIPFAIKKFVNECYEPQIEALLDLMIDLADNSKLIPMLAKTHGQAASPTILGKEIKVFIERLQNQLELLHKLPVGAKFGGATGNFNAHHVAYPNVDWVYFANEFIEQQLGLDRQQYTTQIEHYDMMGALFDNMKRINTILIDFTRDIWTYISMDYFKQKIMKNEVGSSAMPHKVNPIDFENAEGNLGISNAIFEHLSSKLPISRLQRDLTDSTVTRTIGVPAAHTIIAFQSIVKGLGKLIINEEAITKDLNQNWAVLAEAIQTVLRSINYPDPYNKLKELTRTNSDINQESIQSFIQGLEIDSEVKEYLTRLTPSTYTGRMI